MSAKERERMKVMAALTPGPLRSHTFWRLRKRSPLSRGGGWGIMPRVFVSGFEAGHAHD